MAPNGRYEPGSAPPELLFWKGTPGSAVFGCFKGVSKSVQVLFTGIEAASLLTSIVQKQLAVVLKRDATKQMAVK